MATAKSPIVNSILRLLNEPAAGEEPQQQPSSLDPSQEQYQQADIETELNQLDTLVRIIYPEKIASLEKLERVLTSAEMSSYFDSEDVQWVKEDLAQMKADLDQIREIWKRTSSVYTETYLRLSQTIAMRQTVLNAVNDETGIFEFRPQLIDRFAKKQADLAALMDECTAKIREEQKVIKQQLRREQEEKEKYFFSNRAPVPKKQSRRGAAAAAGARKKSVRFEDDAPNERRKK